MSSTAATNPNFVGIQDFKVVASYSYPNQQQDADCFSIMVPGMPRIWQRPTVSPILHATTGWYTYSDQAGPGKSPLEPALRAVLAMQPQYDFNDLDIMTDRRQLRGLMGLSAGESMHWRWGVEMVGNTMLIMRAEHKESEEITKFVGCRRDFEARYFHYKDGYKGDLSFRRLVSYTLGGVKLLVRHPVDGMDGERTFLSDTPTPKNVSGDTIRNTTYDNVSITARGKMMPGHSVLEYYLKRQDNRDFYEDNQPELWLSQTAKFVWANPTSLTKGETLPLDQIRDKVHKQDITEHPNVLADVAQWQQQNQSIVRGLVASLKSLIENVKAAQQTMGGTRFVVRFDQSRQKFVCAVTEDEKLPGVPKDIRDRMLRVGGSLVAATAPPVAPPTGPVWGKAGSAALIRSFLEAKSLGE